MNTFNDDAVARIQRAVRKSEKAPLTGPSYRRRSRARAGKAGVLESFVAPAKIKSGGNGVYTVDILDDAGSVIETDVTAIATRATAYDLPAENSIVVYKLSTDTLGSN